MQACVCVCAHMCECVCVTNNHLSTFSFDILLSGYLVFFAAISTVLSLPLVNVNEN